MSGSGASLPEELASPVTADARSEAPPVDVPPVVVSASASAVPETATEVREGSLPSPLRLIANKMSFINVDKQLRNTEVELLAAEVGQTVGAHTGTAWYETTAPAVEGDDVDLGLARPTNFVRVGFNSHNLLVINIRGVVSRYDFMYVLTKITQGVLCFWILYFAMPAAMSPGGALFSPFITILFGAVGGTLISKLTGIPHLIGMLIAGICWGALPLNVSGGTPPLFVVSVRTVALTTILCRAGINFNWAVMKPVALNVFLISVVPQVTEMFSHAIAAKYLMHHPSWISAILQGAVTAPVSNAVMIPIVSVFRSEGYSVTRGPSLLMMVAGAADNVIAVWIINFLLGIMFSVSNSLSLGWRLFLAPVQVVAGLIIGYLWGRLIVAFINQYHKRSARLKGVDQELTFLANRHDTMILVLGGALFNIFLFNALNLPGTGTVAAATSSAVISHLWTKQGQVERKNFLNQDLAWIWDIIIAPLLFPLVGASVRLEYIMTFDFLPTAFLCLAIGLIAKSAMMILLQSGTGFLWKEKAFFALGFTSKATVQAAIGGRYLASATAYLASLDPNSHDVLFAKLQVEAAQRVMFMSVLAIVCCALGSGIGLKAMGRRLLVKDADFYAPKANKNLTSTEKPLEPSPSESKPSFADTDTPKKV